MSNTDTPERKARLLAVPSLILAFASAILLPWFLETRRRLQNEYWEDQLLFAFVVLCLALCGVPFVFLRLFVRVPVVSQLGWLIAILGYLALIVYVLQSRDGDPFVKLGYSLLGLVCLRWAVQGLCLDSKSPPR